MTGDVLDLFGGDEAPKVRRPYPQNRARPSLLQAGDVFGRLTVVERVKVDGTWRYQCQCSCGGSTVTYGWCLKKGASHSCGCVRSEKGLESGRAGLLIALRDYRRGARRRGLVFDLTEGEFTSLVTMPCHYCGVAPFRVVHSPTEYGRFRCGGIDRVDNALGYTHGNCVPACTQCNRAKSNLAADDFLSKTMRIHPPTLRIVEPSTPSKAEKYRFKIYVNASQRRGIDLLISESLFASYFRMPCAYCGEPPSGKGHAGSKHSGVDRVDNTVGYAAGNIAPCCRWCNSAKRDLTLSQFIAWAARLQAYQATIQTTA
jgi:hypothetical protein